MRTQPHDHSDEDERHRDDREGLGAKPFRAMIGVHTLTGTCHSEKSDTDPLDVLLAVSCKRQPTRWRVEPQMAMWRRAQWKRPA
jgi:hypothetical protein